MRIGDTFQVFVQIDEMPQRRPLGPEDLIWKHAKHDQSLKKDLARPHKLGTHPEPFNQ